MAAVIALIIVKKIILKNSWEYHFFYRYFGMYLFPFQNYLD